MLVFDDHPYRRRPTLEEVMHQGVGSDRIPRMPMRLSQTEFRAYRRGTGTIALHLRAFLLVPSKVNFSLESYLHDVLGTVSISGYPEIPLEELSYSDQAGLPYDGTFLTCELSLSTSTNLTQIDPSVGRLRLRFDMNMHGAPFRADLDMPVIIRRFFTPWKPLPGVGQAKRPKRFGAA